jgi:hypothetical protein
MCNCQNSFHRVNSITAGTSNITLSFTTPLTVVNREIFNFVICTSLPSTTAPLPVLISVNGSTVPLLNKYGNPVYSNELRNRKPYYGYFGSQSTAHVISYSIGDCNCG